MTGSGYPADAANVGAKFRKTEAGAIEVWDGAAWFDFSTILNAIAAGTYNITTPQLYTDHIDEKTSAHGVVVDGILMKDGYVVNNTSAKAIVPIGFVYFQLPTKSAPGDIFHGTWTDVSSYFADVFFRAEGSTSRVFGTHTISTSSTTSVTTTENHNAAVGDWIRVVISSSVVWRQITVVNSVTQVTVGSSFGGSPTGTVLFAQGDVFQGHYHAQDNWSTNKYVATSGAYPTLSNNNSGTASDQRVKAPITDGTNGTPRTSSETRPRNVTIRIWERTA